MPLSAGDRLGPYEVISSIGAGGMGEVYKARDTRLDRLVAIKTSKNEFSERFEREARAVAALNHPNISERNGDPAVWVRENGIDWPLVTEEGGPGRRTGTCLCFSRVRMGSPYWL